MTAAAIPIQRYMRIAGVLLLISAVCGGLGESYIPGRIIVSQDAAATAKNIVGMNGLYRWGFAFYLAEALCDIGLAALFYVLLRPVNRTLALTAAFFGVLSTAMYAVAEGFYFAPTLVLSGAPYLTTFTPDQLNTLALLSMRLFNRIAGIYLIFYGVATLIRGYLIYRSGYLPRFLGAIVAVAGLGFIWQTLSFVLAPRLVTSYFMIPMAIAGISMMLWFLVKGVDESAWNRAVSERPGSA
jgi:hypothetical protein